MQLPKGRGQTIDQCGEFVDAVVEDVDRDAQRFRCEPSRVKEFLDLWIEWVAVYMRARQLWISGRREGVEFPPGTDEYHRLEDAPKAELESDSPFAWNFPP